MSDADAELAALWDAPTVYRPDLFARQTLLVTGGGGGIGRAVALLCARLGARVIICGRTSAKLERVAAFAQARGADVRTIVADVREHAQVDRLFAQIETQCGRLDGVISSAGGQFAQPAIDYSPNGWNAVIANNLNASWFVMQRAARHWRERGGPGSIVNVVVVTERGIPGIAHSVAARAGVIGAMRTVAVEWAPLGIRVNCVAPGLTATEGLDVYPPEAREEFPLANPLKRPGMPMEIAQGCVYLTAPSGSFVTGEVLTIDGGGRLWGELWTAGRPDHFRRDD
ncbi:MAG: SDR family oxidoreductase [Rudaea sp.]|uniref:SDR family NAD(P)-dependent oxidoreductase n=1 Tax=Rudaea sp. TaxID=2136325 RepID=UPI0039E3601A